MAPNAVTFEPMTPPRSMTLSDVRIIWEPSVYGGDGSETRKNIVFEVSSAILETISELERSIDSARLCSCIKGDALKCKINMDSVLTFDACANTSPQPASWRDRIVNATIVIKGIWNTRTQTGLSIEAGAIQLLGAKQAICPFQATLGINS